MAERTWQGLALRVGTAQLLCGVSRVAEIADPGPVTPVCGTVGWFAGLAGLRGNVLPVTDLAAFLGVREEGPGEHARVLVIRRDEENFGLLVDEVLGLRKFPAAALSADVASVPDGLAMYVIEVIHDNGATLPVLDPDLLIGSEKFLNVRAN
ncbi:chemotaxis protein CheW [Granulosicoccaceae sp. 1_MG-2023]|nr:chemotaxis protein CheW [Granulosicoccaceae sp. 1_MG-2023]